MIKVVVLILTVWNTSNGDKLYESTTEFDRFSVTGNLIEDCRMGRGYGKETHRGISGGRVFSFYQCELFLGSKTGG